MKCLIHGNLKPLYILIHPSFGLCKFLTSQVRIMKSKGLEEIRGRKLRFECLFESLIVKADASLCLLFMIVVTVETLMK